MHFFTGGSVIMYYGFQKTLISAVDYCDVFIRLSFWRHPFTAEHTLLRHWCRDTFLQIWWRNKPFFLRHLRYIYVLSRSKSLSSLSGLKTTNNSEQYRDWMIWSDPLLSPSAAGLPASQCRSKVIQLWTRPLSWRRAARCEVREPIWFWLPPDNPSLYQPHPQHACRYQGGFTFLNLPETALVNMQCIIFSTANKCIWKPKR